MSLAFALAMYFVIWWITLFAVLPFGVRTQAEAGEIVPGTPEGAPSGVRMGRLFLINTAVACVVFVLVFIAIQLNVLGLYAGGNPASR
jgi:predicted secreted protein